MTVWYAHIGSIYVSTWSAGKSTVWFDDPTAGNAMSGASFSAVLGSGDILCANNKSGLIIDVDITCLRISTAAEGTGAAGGTFLVSTTRTITANILGGSLTSGLTTSGTCIVTIVGNVTGGTGTVRRGITNTSANVTIRITGDVSGGSGSSANGVYTTAGTITISGNVTANYAHGVVVGGSPSTLTVTGTVTGSSSNYVYGIVSSGGAVTVNGDVVSGTKGAGIYTNTSATVITVNGGNIINGASPAIVGVSPILNLGPTNYIQYPGSNSSITKLALEPAIADIRYLTAIGSNVGICNIPSVDQVLNGVTVDAGSGDYVEASVAQVQAGVNFGPSSSYLGTFAAGGGPLVGEGLVD